MSALRRYAAEWTRRSELGSLSLLRFMVWLSLRAGRGPTRLLLHPIAAYFLCCAWSARRASRLFLERCLGRRPTVRELYGLFLSFASAVHDRVYFLKGRFDLFEIEVNGAEHFDARGALLMGAHLGSFEVLRACGRFMAHREVAMAMYEENARKVNAVLAAIEPAAARDIIALGRIDSMLELGARLDAGALVGVLADRTLGEEAAIAVPFLGKPARFPLGPMRVAAALKRRVFFMTGLYRGGNRYEIHFEPLADFSDLGDAPRAEREPRVRDAVAEYARRVEHYSRAAPNNWFNFHDFWERVP